MIPAFSPAIIGDGLAEELLMVEGDGRDDRDERPADDVGGIEPAAESGLEQQDVGRSPREREEGGGRGDLEEGDRIAPVDAFAFLQQPRQDALVDGLSGELDPLVEADEVRRGVDVHGAAVGDESRPHCRR